MVYIISHWLWRQVLGDALAIVRLADRDTHLNTAVPLVAGLTPKYLVFSSNVYTLVTRGCARLIDYCPSTDPMYLGPNSTYTSRPDLCGTQSGKMGAQIIGGDQSCHLPLSPIIFGNHVRHQAMQQSMDDDIILSTSWVIGPA